MGIDVLPPDVNSSYGGFTVEGDAVRFGMGAVKNVGSGPVDAIVEERDSGGPFKDIFDFCRRIDSRLVNRRVLESLNRAGAFASTGWFRSQVEEVLDDALGEGQVSQRERASGQTSLLDLMGAETVENIHKKPETPEWQESNILAYEREVMGLYVSSHPLARYAQTIERYSSLRLADFDSLPEGHEVVAGGLIDGVKHYVTQRGNKMAFLTLVTLEGPCDVTVFSDIFELRASLLVKDMIVLIPARVNYRDGRPGLVATDVLAIDDAEDKLTKAVHIALKCDGLEPGAVDRLAEILGARPGRCDVYLHCWTPEQGEVTVHATSACRVEQSDSLRREVEAVAGEDSMWYSGGNGLPRHQ